MLALPVISQRLDINITLELTHEFVVLCVITLKVNSIIDFSLGVLYKKGTICMIG